MKLRGTNNVSKTFNKFSNAHPTTVSSITTNNSTKPTPTVRNTMNLLTLSDNRTYLSGQIHSTREGHKSNNLTSYSLHSTFRKEVKKPEGPKDLKTPSESTDKSRNSFTMQGEDLNWK